MSNRFEQAYLWVRCFVRGHRYLADINARYDRCAVCGKRVRRV
jgi:hypothetical protein